MALVADKWFLVVNLVDSGNNTFSKRYRLAAIDAATAATSAAAVVAALDAITECPIVSHYHYQETVENALVLPVGVQGENKALLTFRLEGAANKSASDTIPAPIIGVFVTPTGNGSNVINGAHAAIATYRDLFIAGGNAFISDGENVTELKGGKRIHSKSNRG